MITKKNKSRVNKLPIILLCIFLCFLCFYVPVRQQVYADEIQYTDVLEDLQKDSAFYESEWYNLVKHPQTEIMQIAESWDRQLFIYVHMVGDDKGFEKIVFNTSMVFSALDFRSYEIELVSNKGEFYKYLVKGYKSPQDNYHTYSITRLEYPVDKPVQGTQQVTYEYFPIEQIWTVQKSGNKTEYSYEYMKTIEITDKYVGSHNAGVEEGLLWGYQYSSWTDTFYIAFSTDLLMEKLIEAQIEYVINVAGPTGIISKGDPKKPINVVINSDAVSKFENDTYDTWWFVSWKSGSEKRTFKSILKPDDFKKNTGITVPKRKNGKSFDWVVTFYNKTQNFSYPGEKVTSWVVPGDTTILRLKFETDGICYNLGVLDNRTSYIPPTPKNGNYWWVWLILAAILLLICIPILPSIISFIAWLLNGLFSVAKLLFKGLWWLISTPFRLIVHLFSGGK